MAAFGATTVRIASVARPRAQLRVARTEAFRCAYSEKGVKTCSAMNLSLALLKRMQAMEQRRSSGPCGPGLAKERTDTEDTRIRRLSRALNPEAHWVIACLVGHIFFNPRR
jgi:hypothetical protein